LTFKSTSFPFAERHRGYWNLDTIRVMVGEDEYVLGSSEIYAPFRFSYHCRLDTVFSNKSGNSLMFTDFQVRKNPAFDRNLTIISKHIK
jgi:hypothetical protein